jgi:PAS domain-containing protein
MLPSLGLHQHDLATWSAQGRDIVDLIADHVGELLDSGPDALIVADESGVIAYVNRQTEVLFGFERNELRGKKVEMLLPERLRATHPSHRRSYGTNPRVRPIARNGIGEYCERIGLVRWHCGDIFVVFPAFLFFGLRWVAARWIYTHPPAQRKLRRPDTCCTVSKRLILASYL